MKAVEDKNWAETINKVLSPSDATHAGRELRLIQEYFLVTCTIRDLIRRYRKTHRTWTSCPTKHSWLTSTKGGGSVST